MFVPPAESVVHETKFWRINHNVSARLEGYLMLGSTESRVYEFSDLSPGALSELGHVISLATQAIRECFQPKHVFVGRYGCAPGFEFHLHILPVYPWLEDRILADSRYDCLGELVEVSNGLGFDAADYLLYTWRELVERGDQCGLPEIDMRKVVGQLREAISRNTSTNKP